MVPLRHRSRQTLASSFHIHGTLRPRLHKLVSDHYRWTAIGSQPEVRTAGRSHFWRGEPMSGNQLGPLVYAFFEDQLKCQKGLRQASVRSYRDALQLFLLFVAEDSRRKLTRLSLSDLTGERVRRFLNFLEQKRHNQVRTRNHRLAAIRSFFDYLAVRVPTMLAEAQHVAAIPVKRTPPPQTLYLEHD